MNVWIRARHVMPLAVAALLAAGLQAMAAPATALSRACHSGQTAHRADGSRAGGSLAGGGGAGGGRRAMTTRAPCGAGAAGWLNPVAGPLALLQRRGLSPRAIPAGHHVAAALPRGARAVPQPGLGSILDGVFCVTAANCWAVGFYQPSSSEVELNEVLHWNGATWSQVTVPNPGGTASGDESLLFNVRCAAAGNCWAVGDYTASGAVLNQVLHWNGTRWSLTVTPDPGGTASGDVNQIFDVACRSTGNCWAVGQDGSSLSQTVNQALHWNGTTWSLVTTPDPGGTSANEVNGLSSIRCPVTGTCLAVGSYGTSFSPAITLNQVLLWNGSTWTQVTTPNPGGTTTDGDLNELFAIACTSSSNCWATGTWGTSAGTFNQALHWNGGTWSLVTTPDPGGVGEALNQLNAITCTSSTNCWAVGTAGADTADLLNQALHWDGGTWSQVTTPNPAGQTNAENELEAVRCTSASNCWSVGFAVNIPVDVLGEALQWNGNAWASG